VVLGTLAHELRAPLGPLANSARIIHTVAADNPQATAAADIIERQVHFIDTMVKNLLEATRAAVGKARLHCQTVDLRTVILDALETCGSALAARYQAVEVLIPDSLSVDLDPDRFQQVLVNLIGNSSKFSPPGSRIWIKSSVDGEQLVLRVEDHGKGIPPELLPRIFELFTQATEEGNGGNGLGLGLGVVKAIVELHGGTVQAKSEGSGRGAEIIIRLPLRQPAANATRIG
jgi:two-component system CheB/CheR fusion protein